MHTHWPNTQNRSFACLLARRRQASKQATQTGKYESNSFSCGFIQLISNVRCDHSIWAVDFLLMLLLPSHLFLFLFILHLSSTFIDELNLRRYRVSYGTTQKLCTIVTVRDIPSHRQIALISK